MGIFSLFGIKIKPKKEKINPKFNFISGEYIFDSNDFEGIARVGDDARILYLLQHKLTGKFFSYEEDLRHTWKQPSDQLIEIDRSHAMKMYLDLTTWDNKAFTKTYEETFNIKLKRFGEETPINKKESINQPELTKTNDDSNFLEVV